MHGIGDVIHDFRVVSILGKGGMGVVYKCEDLKLSRYVALKELGSSLSNDSDFVRRFRQEAHIQAQLSHSNITTLYSYFEENGHYYMALEFAKGKTLKALIKETGPIPEQRTLKIINNVLDALQYAHSHGVIHRDVKPANIIIDDDDNVKVLDFGIAKMAGERGMTQTGQRIGTVSYMSPEQIRTPQDIDIRSDIFSLGVTMFEMLSGRLPYNTDTDSDFEIMNQIVQSALPDPRSYYPQISERTVIILNRMLEKDRDNRFANVALVKHALSPLNTADIGLAIPTPVVPETLSQSDNKLYGIKGWLLVLCILTTIIWPVTHLLSIVGVGEYINSISDEFDAFIGTALLYDLFGMILSLVFGLRLWLMKPGAAKHLSNFLIVRAVAYFFLFLYGVLLIMKYLRKILEMASLGLL